MGLADQLIEARKKKADKSLLEVLRDKDPVSYYVVKIMASAKLYTLPSDSFRPPALRSLYSAHTKINRTSDICALAGEYIHPTTSTQVYTTIATLCPTLSDEAIDVNPELTWDKTNGNLIERRTV